MATSSSSNGDKTKIPLFGQPASCRGVGVTYAQQKGVVEWSWCPQWSWLRLFKWTTSISLVVGIFVLASGVVADRWYVTTLGIILIVFACPVVAILSNWVWNANKQHAFRQARFKSKEAELMWQQVDPLFHYQAKDTYYETTYGGKVLKVLRDGTIEINGQHNDFDDDEARLGSMEVTVVQTE
ncbi:expressed unknown protein [Seminavis robusta]|uniref:Uncharacterized protein n=1 Tax=Seminavis robusta TaxID=568900 RepID=A0A9N8EBW5_9STRA|nr:expressed unknown protein [Seminavis robusta]|eukprot:Sro898_g217630.1 n/a (183) ;mRNA; f:27730-28278